MSGKTYHKSVSYELKNIHIIPHRQSGTEVHCQDDLMLYIASPSACVKCRYEQMLILTLHSEYHVYGKWVYNKQLFQIQSNTTQPFIFFEMLPHECNKMRTEA